MNHPFARGFWLGVLSHAMGRHLASYALWRMGNQELREHHQRTAQDRCPLCGRGEDARRAVESEAARLEGARMTASPMQDRIANKLSLTFGYTEFLITDPRLPEDLRDHVQRAMDGARAAAEEMSVLKRLTRKDYEGRLKSNLRGDDARRAVESEAARLEGARMTASAMQDRIANKLSLTIGYTEFLVTDPRLPEDLRDHVQRAMDGARAAVEQMSMLKRLTPMIELED